MRKNFYTCKCGKTFDDPQAFNGHKSHCIYILGESAYSKKLETDIANLRKAAEVAVQHKRKKKEEELEN